MNRFKRCMAILVLTGLCASNVQAADFNFSGVDTLLKAAIATSAAGAAGSVYFIGSAICSALSNGVNKTAAIKLAVGTVMGLSTAGLVRYAVVPLLIGQAFNEKTDRCFRANAQLNDISLR